MLDASVVQSETERLIELYKPLFGLDDWRIEVTLTPMQDEAYATVAAIFERQRATIEVNPTAFRTLEELEATIRHELFHLITSPLHLLLDFGKIDDPLYHFVNETIVRGIERMYDRLIGGINANGKVGN